jgi:hypothetical protein
MSNIVTIDFRKARTESVKCESDDGMLPANHPELLSAWQQG